MNILVNKYVGKYTGRGGFKLKMMFNNNYLLIGWSKICSCVT